MMAKMAVILSGLAISNEGDAYGLLFTASALGLNSQQITIHSVTDYLDNQGLFKMESSHFTNWMV